MSQNFLSCQGVSWNSKTKSTKHQNKKLQNSSAEFAIKIHHSVTPSFFSNLSILCSETVSRFLPSPRNLPKSSLNLPQSTEKLNWSKKAQKQTLFGLFSNMKKAKGVKKTKNYKFGLKKAKLTTLLAIPVTTAIYMI